MATHPSLLGFPVAILGNMLSSSGDLDRGHVATIVIRVGGLLLPHRSDILGGPVACFYHIDRRYSVSSGCVTLHLYPQPGWLIIALSDKAPGISSVSHTRGACAEKYHLILTAPRLL
jgi:hypothetical protein